MRAAVAPLLLSVAAGISTVSISAQAYVLESSQLPLGSHTYTEDIAYADVDLDGDWDVGLGNGGEEASNRSALWINQGGLQGGVIGAFVDETDPRLPPIQRCTFAVDFADIDGDADQDLFLANTSWLFNQGCLFWVNAGGVQGGTAGYFVDETAERWVGIAGPGSSIPPSFLIGNGTFIAYVRASRFGDLDNDGDLDLVYPSYFQPGDFGEANVPTRLFLNDGDGRFEEFNPAGTTTAAGYLKAGDSGLWCEGTYAQYTTDASGQICDVTARVYDMELWDADGDFDLELLLGDQQHGPRAFANRLDEGPLAPSLGGALGFRDVTSVVLPAYVPGARNIDNDLADLDGDGVLDWAASEALTTFSSNVLARGDEAGHFLPLALLAAGGWLAWDIESLDYDADGDLDLFFANYGLESDLYRNDGSFQFGSVALPAMTWGVSWALEAADVDEDGDEDVLIGTYSQSTEQFLKNVTQVPDQVAPRIPSVESVASGAAAPGTKPVRAHVLDNAPRHTTATYAVEAQLTVDGVRLPAVAARTSGGQVFRAALPANLVGQIELRVTASDRRGNTGVSDAQSWTASHGAPFQLPYGTGTAGLAGGTPALRALSVPFAESAFHLALESGAAGGTPSVVALATQPLAPALAIPGLLTLQLSGVPLLVAPGVLDADGHQVLVLPLGAATPGLSVFAQGFVLDTTGAGEAFASSQGLEIVTQ